MLHDSRLFESNVLQLDSLRVKYEGEASKVEVNIDRSMWVETTTRGDRIEAPLKGDVCAKLE